MREALADVLKRARENRWALGPTLRAGSLRRSPAGALAGVFGAAIFALAALLALGVAGVPGVGSVTGLILGALPRVPVAALVMILGCLGCRLGAFGARRLWTRCGWGRPHLAGKTTAWLVKVTASGLALAVLDVPRVALLIAPGVPLGMISLGAALGIGQVAGGLARCAAGRWLRSHADAASRSEASPVSPRRETEK